MKSITIHGMDQELTARLEEAARAKGLSLNKTIKGLLAAALGVGLSGAADRRRDYEDFCGKWSKKEAKEFEKATEDFERIDGEDWA